MSIVHPGGGQRITPLGFLPGYRSEFVVSAAASEGRLAAAVERIPDGMPHGRHIHRHRDELFFIVEGELEFSLGEQREHAGAGSTVFVPQGVAHSFANTSGASATMLALWVPGNIEGMYRDWARAFPAGAPFDRDRFFEIWRKYDTEPVAEAPSDA